MTPATGERLLRFVGDKIHFTIRAGKIPPPKKCRAACAPISAAPPPAGAKSLTPTPAGAVIANSSWRDVPMQKTADGWQIELPLAEVGFFKAKAYLLDEKNWQHWPDGSDVGISVHPNFARTANTIYCAFTRLFGATKNLASTADEKLEAQLKSLEAQGYATLPPSGKFRDLDEATAVHRQQTRLPHHSSAARASDADDLRAFWPLRQPLRRAGFDCRGSRARRIRQAHHWH